VEIYIRINARFSQELLSQMLDVAKASLDGSVDVDLVLADGKPANLIMIRDTDRSFAKFFPEEA